MSQTERVKNLCIDKGFKTRYKNNNIGKYYEVYKKHNNKIIHLFSIEDQNGSVVNGTNKKKGLITTWTEWHYIHKLKTSQTLGSALGLTDFYQYVKDKGKVGNRNVKKGLRQFYDPTNKYDNEVNLFLDQVITYFDSEFPNNS